MVVVSAPAQRSTAGGVTTDTGGPMCPDSNTACLKSPTCDHMTGYRYYGCRCPKCVEATQRYRREYYMRDGRREKRLAKQRSVMAEHRAYIAEYKLARGCTACGYAANPSALVFHHRDQDDKDMLVNPSLGSWASVLAEMEKCDVMCANCHAELHYPVAERGTE